MAAILYHIEHGAGLDEAGIWHDAQEYSTMPDDEGRSGNPGAALAVAIPFCGMVWVGLCLLVRWLWRM